MAMSQSDRTELIQAFKASGQTQKMWCQENGIKIHTLRYWLSRERNPTATSSENPQWLTFQVKDKTQTLNPQPLTIQVGSFSIAVHPGFDPEHLQNVLRTLTTL